MNQLHGLVAVGTVCDRVVVHGAEEKIGVAKQAQIVARIQQSNIREYVSGLLALICAASVSNSELDNSVRNSLR